MYRLVGKISPDQLGIIARQLYIEMLKAGYTSVAEFHYVHHDTSGQPYADPAELSLRISQAASAAGIGLTLLPVLYSHSGFGGQAPNEGQRRFINSTENYLKLQSRLQPLLARQPAQQLGLCFHSLRAVTRSRSASAGRQRQAVPGAYPYRRTAEGSRRLPDLERTPTAAMAV